MKIRLALLSLTFVSLFVAEAVAQRTNSASAGTARRRSAIDYYNRANQWQKENRLDQALEDYTFALTFDPSLAQAWNNRGVVHYLQGEYEAALRDYTKALELKPDYAEAWNNRGNARLDKGAHVEAIADFDQALKLGQRHPRLQPGPRLTSAIRLCLAKSRRRPRGARRFAGRAE
jgi:tetratricopeptide (TPR) repeat protein